MVNDQEMKRNFMLKGDWSVPLIAEDAGGTSCGMRVRTSPLCSQTLCTESRDVQDEREVHGLVTWAAFSQVSGQSLAWG